LPAAKRGHLHNAGFVVCQRSFITSPFDLI